MDTRVRWGALIGVACLSGCALVLRIDGHYEIAGEGGKGGAATSSSSLQAGVSASSARASPLATPSAPRRHRARARPSSRVIEDLACAHARSVAAVLEQEI